MNNFRKKGKRKHNNSFVFGLQANGCLCCCTLPWNNFNRRLDNGTISRIAAEDWGGWTWKPHTLITTTVAGKPELARVACFVDVVYGDIWTRRRHTWAATGSSSSTSAPRKPPRRSRPSVTVLRRSAVHPETLRENCSCNPAIIYLLETARALSGRHQCDNHISIQSMSSFSLDNWSSPEFHFTQVVNLIQNECV